MGFSLPVMRYIVREHKKEPFKGKVLTLGRQRVVATYPQVIRMMRKESYTPSPIPDHMDLKTNIPAWRGTHLERCTSDVVFFKLLGIDDFAAMDISDYEKADIVWDLNKPIPEELKTQFDVIIDGGTLEHVFNAWQAIENVNAMLKPFGRAYHLSPSSNYMDHGYFQFSPIFFKHYYEANGFDSVRVQLAEHARPFSSTEKWKLYEYEPGKSLAPFSWVLSNRSWASMACARKGMNSTVGKMPQQGEVTIMKNPPAEGMNRGLIGVMKRMRPAVEKSLKRHTMLWGLAIRILVRLLYFARRHPIQHRYIGKL